MSCDRWFLDVQKPKALKVGQLFRDALRKKIAYKSIVTNN
jgi:hypothetical protein